MLWINELMRKLRMFERKLGMTNSNDHWKDPALHQLDA